MKQPSYGIKVNKWNYSNSKWLFIYVTKTKQWYTCMRIQIMEHCTVYPKKKYAHGFCFAVLCCGYTLTDFPISIRLTLLALWQFNDCHSASKATLMNMDEYFMWIHYERLHNHNKAKHNKTACIFLGIYCIWCNCFYVLTIIEVEMPCGQHFRNWLHRKWFMWQISSDNH